MRVKPAPNRVVCDPMTGRLLPEAGAEVPDNQFWQRRIQDGDVVLVTTARPGPRGRPRARQSGRRTDYPKLT